MSIPSRTPQNNTNCFFLLLLLMQVEVPDSLLTQTCDTPSLQHSAYPPPWHTVTQAAPNRQKLYLLVGTHPHKRANAATMVGIYSVLFLNLTPEQACAPLTAFQPYAGFRDASCGQPTWTLGVADAVAGLWKAKQVCASVYAWKTWGPVCLPSPRVALTFLDKQDAS